MDKNSFYQRVKQLKITSAKLVEGIYSGSYRSTFKGPGLEFDEAREYVFTDDARFIDWNVTSRMGSPFTKTFREEREMVLQLAVDLSPSLWSGSGALSKRDLLNILFANFSWAAANQDDRVGALFFTDRIEGWIAPGKGNKHASRMIEDCLTLEATGRGSNLSLGIRSSHESMKRRGILVILSDFRSTGYWKDLTIAAKKHDVIAIMISDPLDEALPSGGGVELQDPETLDTLYSQGNSPSFSQQYKDNWALMKLIWLKECHKRGVETLEIGTGEDPTARLLSFFNRRRKVR